MRGDLDMVGLENSGKHTHIDEQRGGTARIGMKTVQGGTEALGAVDAGFGLLEVATGFIHGGEVDEGLGEISGVHLAFIEALADGERRSCMS
jgi:hypothetical protein